MKKTLGILIVLAFTLSSCQSSLFNSHITPAPTPQCVEPILTLGATQFRIESVTREQNKFPEIPKRKKDVAYWVEGTNTNYVFALSPTKDNISLNTVLKAGDPAIINWADCSKDEYVVKSIDSAQPYDMNLFDQTTGGLTVYVQTDSSNLVIHAERPITQPAETAVVVPDDQPQIDVALSEQPAADSQTVSLALTITNRGQQPLTLTDRDISLTAQNNSEVFPTNVAPLLPQEIQPGDNLTITVSFPKPTTPSSVLRILNLTFEYYFQ